MLWEFNADEVFEMAEQIEQNGYRFYKSASENVQDPAIKQFLLEMAEMESKHEKTFVSLRFELTGDEKGPLNIDPYDESALYLKALADTRVFFEKEIDISSIEEILMTAIQAEKDSIAFYLGMKDMVPDELGKDKIDRIIKEEMSHIRILSEKLLDLNQ